MTMWTTGHIRAQHVHQPFRRQVSPATPVTHSGRPQSAGAAQRSVGAGAAPPRGHATPRMMHSLSRTDVGPVFSHSMTAPSRPAPPAPAVDPDEVDSEEIQSVFKLIDADNNGSVSKLELVDAVYRHPEVGSFILRRPSKSRKGAQPPSAKVEIDERSFDAVDSIFDSIAGGRTRIRYSDFVSFFSRRVLERASNSREMRAIFELIDTNQNGTVSKLELLAAVQNYPTVATFLLPGVDSSKVMSDERVFDAVTSVFTAVSGGKKRIDFGDFEAYFRRATALTNLPSPCRKDGVRDRRQTRVLVIGSGFGKELNREHAKLLTDGGYQLRWVNDLPNTDQVRFNLTPYLGKLKAEIQDFRPHVVLGASRGGVYITGLWQVGYWRGPTVMINGHPSLPQRLPPEVTLVLAHGSNDEAYGWSRHELQDLLATGTKNRCFLYYTANSGQLYPGGSLTRVGDRHVMESLLLYDCLPRLIDASLSTAPEVHFLQTWRERLSEPRKEAEHWLGFTPERLRRFWVSPSRRGVDAQKLYDVPRTSEEFRRVASLFKAAPAEAPAYMLSPQAAWERVTILRIERVENGQQEEYSGKPYRDVVRRSLQQQGVEFEAGVHTCFAFHGADAEAFESIIRDPISGFQPLASGSRNASVWGCGTYFARDAKYVADGQFCAPRPDGTRSMLLCLLTLGMPCLGDPQQKGVLPFRQKPHRYNSAVDSLSSPEVMVVQHPGAAYPAYLITFV